MVTKCALGYKVNVTHLGCSSCSTNSYCDGVIEISCDDDNVVFADSCTNGLIERCIIGMKLVENECYLCGLNSICNGIEELSCNSVNGAYCYGGKIMQCL